MTIRTTHKHTFQSIDEDLLNGKVKIVRKEFQGKFIQETFKRNLEIMKKRVASGYYLDATVYEERICFHEELVNSFGGFGIYMTRIIILPQVKGCRPMFTYDQNSHKYGTSTIEDIRLWNKMSLE